MKTEKINVTKLFKIGILFFGISLLLWNCEKEEIISNPSHSNLLSKLQSEFNPESFKKTIPYEFEVIWNNKNKKYHKELEKYYYEFPIKFTNSFNPNNFKSKNISKYSTIYKVFVIENENQEHSFYIYKTFTEDINRKTLKNKNILFEEDEVLNGFNHILNNEGEIVYAEKIENGKKDEKILFRKEFKKKKTKDNYQSRMMEDCYTVTIFHYVDNYLVWKINGEPDQWVFAGSKLTGTSTSQVCESYWLPDLNIGGGGNSGGYYTNPGNSPAYQDCQSNSNKNYQGKYVEEDNPCKYVISVNPIECGDGYVYDALLDECVVDEYKVPPSCKSFTFNKLGNYQYSYVKGVRFLIIDKNGRKDYIKYENSIEFGAPYRDRFNNVYENGPLAESSANALQEAMENTKNYIRGSVITSQGDIERYFENELIRVYPNHIPGARVKIRPTNILFPPTNYKASGISIGGINFGTDNCN